ncbi:hypothetical protein EB093_09605 [bacterium]|nr:hypothetical protein [bacterium]
MNTNLDQLVLARESFRELPLMQHMIGYLEMVAEKKVSLTQTGNINRASMDAISNIIPYPDHHSMFPIRNQSEWLYLSFIDAMCHVSKRTQNRKGKKVLTKNGKSFLALTPEIQFIAAFHSFYEELNWDFFCYRERDFDPMERLQANRMNAFILLYDIPDWMDINEFCVFVSDKLGIDNRDDGISVINHIFLRHLELFGIIEVDNQSNYQIGKRFKLSQLGRVVCEFIFGQRNMRFQ